MPRIVSDVAFDQFVFDDRGLTDRSGATVVRGSNPDGTVLAVGSMPWPDLPVGWVALQSRRAPDLLALAGDEMEPVGHRNFDDRFAVDADDVSLFRKRFRTSLRDWLVEFDDEHGPLIVIFDGADADGAETPRRRATDPAEDAPVAERCVFVARIVNDDPAAIATLDVTRELAEHVRAAMPS